MHNNYGTLVIALTVKPYISIGDIILILLSHILMPVKPSTE